MSLNKITKIERIALLSQLVKKYCLSADITKIIKLAKDLANVIDELRCLDVDFKTLSNEFINLFPEHWQERTNFLLIVIRYWRQILAEKNLCDIDISQTFFNSEELIKAYDVERIYQKISICSTENIYEEIDFIINIVKNNSNEQIAIASPDKYFTRYLMTRFDDEEINYSSYCDNKLSETFLEEIRNNFDVKNDDELIEIAKELSDINDNFDMKNAHVLLIYPKYIYKIPKNCIVIYSELNERTWKPQYAGYFWLHYILRKNLGLAHDMCIDENMFCYGIKTSSKAYLIRSLKSGGQNNKKSSLLAKLEVIAEKQKKQICKLDNTKSCDMFPDKQKYKETITTEYFKLPSEIDVYELEKLISNPLYFYAQKILNLVPTIVAPKMFEINKILKKLVLSCFNGQSQDVLMHSLKNVDLLAYFKGKEIVKKIKPIKSSISNIRGEIVLQDFGIKLTGCADLIVENDSNSTLFCIVSSNTISTKQIIYEGNSHLLSLCFIAENHGFKGLNKPIRKIKILNLNEINDGNFNEKEIEISEQNLEDFKKRLNENLKNYFGEHVNEIDCNLKQKHIYNKYAHFIRS